MPHPAPSTRLPPRLIVARAVIVALALAGWFGTQELLGSRAPNSPPDEMTTAGKVISRGDGLHVALASWHAWLKENRPAANALLIGSSLLIDTLGVFLLAWSIFGQSLRPIVGLLVLFALRQLCQVVSAVPAPDGMIWESPGFPSLLVTYGVANDFFFSGHTALAVYGSIELGRFGGRALRVTALVVGLFLTLSVVVLRAHYTMDVYAGAVTALMVALVARRLAQPVDRALSRLGSK
ncbi:MAG: phosphatase PAP2 family protein [Planctomycetia bacterium]|nr:phosphatase PAP2 family protein [Planctomycetia bacterium]